MKKCLPVVLFLFIFSSLVVFADHKKTGREHKKDTTKSGITATVPHNPHYTPPQRPTQHPREDGRGGGHGRDTARPGTTVIVPRTPHYVPPQHPTQHPGEDIGSRRHHENQHPRFYPPGWRGGITIIIPPPPPRTSPRYPRSSVHIYYTRSVLVTMRRHTVEEAIGAGRYGWFDPSINSYNFPANEYDFGSSKEIYIFAPTASCIDSQEVISDMAELGYHPATLMEFLALGEEYPDIQTDCPLVCLGSSWQNLVPLLLNRGIGLYNRDSRWTDYYRFVAVRN